MIPIHVSYILESLPININSILRFSLKVKYDLLYENLHLTTFRIYRNLVYYLI